MNIERAFRDQEENKKFNQQQNGKEFYQFT